MRWLLIALLVSLGALLFAATAVARHILSQRADLSPRALEHIDSTLDSVMASEETEVEP
jgi:hypothetical protein